MRATIDVVRPTGSADRTLLRAGRALGLSWIEGRPVVQVVYSLRFATAVLLGGDAFASPTLPALHLPVAAASWVAAMWAVYLLNGVTDLVEDRANGSRRPIARGALPVSAAMAVTGTLSAVALGTAALVSLRQVALTVVVLGVGAAYSAGPRPLKNSVAGCFAAVVALGGLTYAAGFSAVGSYGGRPAGLAVAVAMSLWMGCAGATKDLGDIEGDRLAGRRTLPVRLGEVRARRLIALAVLTLAAAFATSAVLLGTTPGGGGALLAAAILLAGAVRTALTLRGPVGGDRSARRRPYRCFMVTQYFVHIALIALIGGSFI